MLDRGHWTALPPAPVRPRQDATLVWTGQLLLELGGTVADVAQPDGAVYDETQRRWHLMPPAPAPVGTADEAHVWAAGRLFVFGGRTPPYHVASSPDCCVGGLYDASANRWSLTSRSPLPAMPQVVAVWTGHDVIVAGLTEGQNPTLRAASYDLTADRWRSLDPPHIAGHIPEALTAVATADRVIVWSMWGRVRRTGPGSSVGYSGVDVFALAGRRWTTVTGDWPQHHTVDRPTDTRAGILFAPGQIWCGACSHPAPVGEHGYVADPETLMITPIPAGPLDDLGPWTVWTGRTEISLNAGGEMTGPHLHARPGDIAFWDSVTDSWTRGPRAPAVLDSSTQPVWDGHRLLALASDGRVLAFG